ncbi:MAG: 50S ribosomal protein L21e [Candidatus Pacearchaeota archaeon]
MVRGRRIRERGKISLSRYFQKINKGDRVIIKVNLAKPINFPKRMQGRTGVVEGIRGRAFIIKLKDMGKEKKFIIDPIHLKKVEN